MKQRIHQAASSHQPGGNFFQLKQKAILKKVVAFGCILIALASSQLLQQLLKKALASCLASWFLSLHKEGSRDLIYPTARPRAAVQFPH
jgi:hypothetical protein